MDFGIRLPHWNIHESSPFKILPNLHFFRSAITRQLIHQALHQIALAMDDIFAMVLGALSTARGAGLYQRTSQIWSYFLERASFRV